MIRYRFCDFTLSPQRRLLVRDGREVPLIPRYFDLLVLLIERRHEAVHRREIFDRVWTGVSVSESALSQAVRTIHAIADAVHGSRATPAPLGRLIGEPDIGPVSRAIIAFGEAAIFGLGLAHGLMRRPPSPESHVMLTPR